MWEYERPFVISLYMQLVLSLVLCRQWQMGVYRFHCIKSAIFFNNVPILSIRSIASRGHCTLLQVPEIINESIKYINKQLHTESKEVLTGGL